MKKRILTTTHRIKLLKEFLSVKGLPKLNPSIKQGYEDQLKQLQEEK